jgi:hypothetical protein
MDSSLHEVWQTAAGSPFLPTVGKGSQFFVGFVLLALGLAITGGFALSEYFWHTSMQDLILTVVDRSLANVVLLGVPGSLAVAYVSLDAAEAQALTIVQIRRRLHVLRSRSLRLEEPPRETGRPLHCTLEARKKSHCALVYLIYFLFFENPRVLLLCRAKSSRYGARVAARLSGGGYIHSAAVPAASLHQLCAHSSRPDHRRWHSLRGRSLSSHAR